MIRVLAETDVADAAAGWLRRQGLVVGSCADDTWAMRHTLPLLLGDVLDLGQKSPVLPNIWLLGLPGLMVGERLQDAGRFDPASFDVVVNLFADADLEPLFTAAARLLRPGGKLILARELSRLDAAAAVVAASRHGLELRAVPSWELGVSVQAAVPTFIVFQKPAAPAAPRVLIVNHSETACGVYQFGRIHAQLLARSRAYTYDIADCASAADLRALRLQPAAYIFNYLDVTMPWADRALVQSLGAPCIGIHHGITTHGVGNVVPDPFHHWVCNEPPLPGASPYLSFVGRPILPYEAPPLPPSDAPTIGTFGFGSVNKGHKLLIELAGKQLARAVVRFQIAHGVFGDPTGALAQTMVAEVHALAAGFPHLRVEFSHDFMPPQRLLKFLAGNTLNTFFYSDGGSGLSSALDYGLAVPRPVALTQATMFRHVLASGAPVRVDQHTLPDIIARGTAPLDPLRRLWTPARLVADFDAVVSKMLEAHNGRRDP